MELTLPIWGTCYMYVITGGENTSSTVILKLGGKLCNPFKDLDRDFENNPIFLLAKIF